MFIQPCFIRKNTPELRKKLEELGYKDSTFVDLKLGGIITFPSRNEYSVWANYHFNVHTLNSYIDCGTNKELFLALAALRDDSDYMQWFICDDNESMFKVDKPDMSMSKFIHEYMDGWDVSGARKATVEEIIEHIKE